ncbi:MAG: hypothetical protein F4180_06700 [Chloroflexi bacterium]|nr:hypothetical protein [Chloroflexota bacterium]
MVDRAKDIERFYSLLTRLEDRVGGKIVLDDCDGHEKWPQGVYFFFERGELRRGTPTDLRVVYVGTHGTNFGSPSTLWWRLTQHKNDVGRSSLRDHLAMALRNRSCANGNSYSRHNHQTCVSRYVDQMPLLWLKAEGENGHELRKAMERNAIALLSFWRKDALGRPSDEWLGNWRQHKQRKVERSGLWNVNFVTKGYEPKFLDDLERCVEATEPFEPRGPDWNAALCLN